MQGKLVNKTIDDDYAELSERLFGEGNCFNSSEVRKRMYGMRTVLDAIDRDEEASVSSEGKMRELIEIKADIRRERQRMCDERAAYNKIHRERARQEELNDIITRAVTTAELPEFESVPPQAMESDNDLLVSLNDIHYGAVINNYWNTYDSDKCRAMMEAYVGKIVEIGKRHGSEDCIVWANGDQISGNIHHTIQLANKENVVEQVQGVAELISGFIAELSKYFQTVRYVSVAGNHSRIDTKDRSPKDERLDDLVEWYLMARLQNIENVDIGSYEKIDSTMYVMNVRGKNYVGVHGDYDGSKYKVQSLVTMSGTDVYAVLLGHMHHNMIDTVQGIKTIMAGSFMGVDNYCIEKRLLGRPEQLVCVCDDTGVVCYYDIPM